ncbi:asparagine--tRNA ligase, cytoplasmic 1-like [Dorcoceras hygrometricum]|uniref:Asparagine--tRNA ligase, cytoplasmic 1-like n=1 Tax=Dorcoceras hygrometricum TaxID=472368 RepID=A0A2Z7AAL2_9LAMI|nr:asparagine--tRNA ligase, cytoplasmic 1-like [Dorcoceras hygrometricum]
MSLFDLQDVRIAIGSLSTLDLPMVVDLIGIYGLKGPYCTLTTTKWFLQALSVIPRGSWGDVARRSYHDPLGKSGIMIPEPQCSKRRLPPLSKPPPPLPFVGICSGQIDEENPSALISSGLLVQADEGVSYPVVDLIDVIYRRLPSKMMRRRFVVATGSPAASEFRCCCLLLVFSESYRLDDVSGATSFELVAMLRFEVATGSSREKRCVVLATGYPAAGLPFVPYPSNPRALFSRELFQRFPVVSDGCFARARLLPESSGFLAGLVVAQYKHVAYTHGNPGSTAGRGFNPAGGAPGGG